MICLSDKEFSPERGVTLLEMLVVLTIISMTLVLFGPMTARLMSQGAQNREAELMISTIRGARADALARGRSVDFLIETESRRYGLEGGPMNELSATRDIEFTGAAELMPDSVSGVLRFYPDGSASGAVISLRSEKESDTISVDWLTGAATLRRERLK
jgi:general secretion pathway protein H